MLNTGILPLIWTFVQPETKQHDLLFSSLGRRLVCKHSDEDARIKPDEDHIALSASFTHPKVDLKSFTWK